MGFLGNIFYFWYIGLTMIFLFFHIFLCVCVHFFDGTVWTKSFIHIHFSIRKRIQLVIFSIFVKYFLRRK